MRIAGLVLGALHLLGWAAALPGASNATHPPLFPSSPPTLPTLHTSLASLLPVLPYLAPPPEHTLLVTLATPAFKPLLYNWLCFLRGKAKWGAFPSHTAMGEPYEPSERCAMHADTPKLLVVTSDEDLARELSDHGVVTWWVRGTDWDAVELADELAEDDPDKDAMLAYAERMLQDDLFANIRLLDLLLPADEPVVENADGSTVIPWGTLRYQSLMLERTVVMSALVGALAQSQRADPEWRKAQDAAWMEKVLAHDWESGPPLRMPEFEGVKGVLLVDNDAVWLSSPNAFLSHYYRPTGPHPSIIYAPDMDPTTRNAWGTNTMPCACFFYSRVSDAGAQKAAPSHAPDHSPLDPYVYSPSAGAAEVWRSTALCHISMLQEALEAGQRLSQWRRVREDAPADQSLAPELDLGAAPPPSAAKQAAPEPRAPSFQATALGPAVFLAEQRGAFLPEISYERFLAALGSGEVDDLTDLLEDAELDLNPATGRADRGRSCLALAQAQQTQCASPHAESELGAFATSLTREYLEHVLRAPPPHRPVRVEPLPFDAFPPGMRFFDGGIEPGARPCVVHANYATGGMKEQLLRDRGLWALVRPEEGDGEWRCDAEVMQKA
ncbi:hypothetical protein JCM10450v2_007392 [Rhodotorula kratochvilovae]